jgi:transposase
VRTYVRFTVRGTPDDGGVDKDVLEDLLGRGLSLERIAARFGVHPSTVSYWLKKHGVSAAHAERHAPRGGIPRAKLAELVKAGGSHRSIAAEVGLSVATVRHWLKRFGLETNSTTIRRQAREDKVAGHSTLVRVCGRHGPTEFALYSDGSYRCARCRREAVAKRRRAVRAAIIREAGGQCVLCGYDRYVGALQFHHLEPNEKRFGISSRGITRSAARVRDEARKCVLLCGNCHAEVEGGVRALPLKFRGSLKGLRPEADYPG